MPVVWCLHKLARQTCVWGGCMCAGHNLYPHTKPCPCMSPWALFSRKPIIEPNRTEPSRSFGLFGFRFGSRFCNHQSSGVGFCFGFRMTEFISPVPVLLPCFSPSHPPTLARIGPTQPRSCSPSHKHKSLIRRSSPIPVCLPRVRPFQ